MLTFVNPGKRSVLQSLPNLTTDSRATTDDVVETIQALSESQ